MEQKIRVDEIDLESGHVGSLIKVSASSRTFYFDKFKSFVIY